MSGERTPVSGVLLAAGGSRRFPGPVPKQLLPFGGEPLVRRAARAALAAGLAELLLVVGHRKEEVAAAVVDLPLRTVDNRRFAEGLSTSVRRGLEAVSPESAAALFLTADQPFLDAATLEALLAAYRERGGPIVEPSFGDRRGSPVLFDRSLFPELAALEGDVGGRALVRRHCGEVVRVELPSGLPLLDVDTAEGYARLLRLTPPGSAPRRP